MDFPQGSPDSPVEQIPTHIAAASNNVTELESLVQEGAQLVSQETKETPLHAAAKTGALNATSWLLDNKTVSPLDKASNGNSAAHYAAVYGHSNVLKVCEMSAYIYSFLKSTLPFFHTFLFFKNIIIISPLIIILSYFLIYIPLLENYFPPTLSNYTTAADRA